MKKFKFETSATEGSIHNPADWDYMPEAAKSAYMAAVADITDKMKAIPDSVSDEEYEATYWKIRSEKIQVIVERESSHFRSQATEQVNTGNVTLIIN